MRSIWTDPCRSRHGSFDNHPVRYVWPHPGSRFQTSAFGTGHGLIGRHNGRSDREDKT